MTRAARISSATASGRTTSTPPAPAAAPAPADTTLDVQSSNLISGDSNG